MNALATVHRDTLSPVNPGGERVTRDMNLMCRIMVSIRDRTDLTPRPVTIEGEDETVVGRHVEMLYKAGFLDVGGIFQSTTDAVMRIQVRDLSWEGHDFLAVLLNATVWGRIKAAFGPETLATMPLTIIRDLGMEALKDWGREMLKAVTGPN